MPVVEQYQISGRSAREIAASVEGGIREGRLSDEQRLPAIRELAATLEVSPATVAAAYRQLRERGLVLAGGRRGTVVRPRPPVATPRHVAAPPGVRDLRMGIPDPRLLPDLGPVLASLSPSELVARHLGRNDDALLELARDQFAADDVDAAHLAVVGGALDGIERVLGTCVDRGDLVAVEDPVYPPILDLIAALGATPLPVAVDEEGPLPAELERALRRRPAALIVVPRAQNPTGASISRSRGAELSALLDQHDQVTLIEDDAAHGIADTPFQMLARKPRGRWSVIRSVSKSLHPDLRLAVIAGDEVTISRLEGRQALGTGWVSTILQHAVANLWSDPSTEAVVARARSAYAARRTALIEALEERGMEARGQTGLNVWVPVREEAAVVEALLASGWAVHAGERFRLRSAPGIRVTISTLEPDEAPALADAIAEADHGRSTRSRPY